MQRALSNARGKVGEMLDLLSQPKTQIDYAGPLGEKLFECQLAKRFTSPACRACPERWHLP